MGSTRALDVFDQKCPSRRALEIITAKWSVLVIYALETGPQRYNQLLKRIGGISPKMLTKTLNSLQAQNILVKAAAQSGEHADYSLSSLGQSITGLLSEVCRWAESHQDEISDGAGRWRRKVLSV